MISATINAKIIALADVNMGINIACIHLLFMADISIYTKRNVLELNRSGHSIICCKIVILITN